MPKTTEKELMVCEECFQAIAYDEYSGLDYYGKEYSDRRYKEITEGIDEVCSKHGYIACGDFAKEYEDSDDPCDVCGEDESGRRLHMVAMGNC